jgi:hypothetical protein
VSFRRLCARCGDLVALSADAANKLACPRCGGTLVGPVALPTPTTYRERCDVLGSPHYAGAVARAPATRPRAEARAAGRRKRSR